MSDWWMIMHTPAGCNLWPVGEADNQRQEDLAMRARTLIGFPQGDEWITSDSWRIAFTPGEPHPKLVARSTVHKLADLDAVDAAALAAYRDAYADATRAEQVAAARAAIAELDPDTRAALLAEYTTVTVATPAAVSTKRSSS